MSKSSLLACAALAALALVPLSASADAIFTGDTTGGPTFARPLSFTATSSNATAVAYVAQPFTVDLAGQYIFEVDGATPRTIGDTYALVYSGSFNPATPLVNLIAGDDDYTGAFTILPGSSPALVEGSRIALGETSNFGGATTGLLLAPGTQYIAVVTTFGDTNAQGTFTAGIGDGPGGGTVTLGAVPEPTSLALTGLGGLALLGRRRR